MKGCEDKCGTMDSMVKSCETMVKNGGMTSGTSMGGKGK